MTSGKTDDVGSKFYLYSRGLWLSARKQYSGSVRGERFRDHQQLEITDQIQASARKFGIIRAGKKESAHSFVAENNQRGTGNCVTRHAMNTVYIQGNLVGEMSMIWLPRLVLIGGNANGKADVANISANTLGEVKTLTTQKREGGQRGYIRQIN